MANRVSNANPERRSLALLWRSVVISRGTLMNERNTQAIVNGFDGLMSQAIFGLIGVVVGGLISGGVSVALARRTEWLGAKVAARLVREDLLLHVLLLEDVLSSGSYSPSKDKKLRDKEARERSWLEHRPRLAAVMMYGDYGKVIEAQAAADGLDAWIVDRTDPYKLNKQDQERLNRCLEAMRPGLYQLLNVAK